MFVSCECFVLWRMCVNGVVPSSVRSSLFLFTYWSAPAEERSAQDAARGVTLAELRITPLSRNRKARATHRLGQIDQ